MDKKMRDNEIISIDEAIRHCYEVYHERDDMCKECREEHRQLAKWLEELNESRETINRKDAEIEELRADNNYLFETMPHLKSEAIKEYAERLKEKADKYGLKYWTTVEDIDNLVKEMTENDFKE